MQRRGDCVRRYSTGCALTAGEPAHTSRGGTLLPLGSTDPAARIAPSPTELPERRTAPIPIDAPSPTCCRCVVLFCCRGGVVALSGSSCREDGAHADRRSIAHLRCVRRSMRSLGALVATDWLMGVVGAVEYGSSCREDGCGAGGRIANIQVEAHPLTCDAFGSVGGGVWLASSYTIRDSGRLFALRQDVAGAIRERFPTLARVYYTILY